MRKPQPSKHQTRSFSHRYFCSKACLFAFLCRNPIAKTSHNANPLEEDDNELDEKYNTLQEMFPQLTKKQLLEVRRWGACFATPHWRLSCSNLLLTLNYVQVCYYHSIVT